VEVAVDDTYPSTATRGLTVRGPLRDQFEIAGVLRQPLGRGRGAHTVAIAVDVDEVVVCLSDDGERVMELVGRLRCAETCCSLWDNWTR